MDDFVPMMTMRRMNLFYDNTLATHLNWGDFKFAANISPIPGTNHSRFRIYLSGGLLMAVDDLAFRAFCNQAFFSWEIGAGQRWMGCRCYFAHLHKNHVKPELRYWDYSYDASTILQAAAQGEPLFTHLIPLFYSGVPIDDDERIRAAKFAANIAYAWVLAHEVGHYRNGHFDYLRANPTAFGRKQNLTVAAGEVMMAEGSSPGNVPVNHFLKRFLEWDADRAATESVVDIFFNPDQAGNLPSYCDQKSMWLFRVILLGMIMAAMIFDRAAQASGDSASHPPGLVRVIGIIIAASRRLNELTFPGPIYDKELAEFAGTPRIQDHFFFLHAVIADLFTDIHLLAEIIENENIEGSRGQHYAFPIGNDGEDATYLVYQTLITMCRPPFSEMFTAMRDKAVKKQPDGRWTVGVFQEVKSYLDAEVRNPASHELNKRADELRDRHADRLLQVRGADFVKRVFGEGC